MAIQMPSGPSGLAAHSDDGSEEWSVSDGLLAANLNEPTSGIGHEPTYEEQLQSRHPLPMQELDLDEVDACSITICLWVLNP